jgi:hypothetical protein
MEQVTYERAPGGKTYLFWSHEVETFILGKQLPVMPVKCVTTVPVPVPGTVLYRNRYFLYNPLCLGLCLNILPGFLFERYFTT